MSKVFVDTNIFVYSLDQSEPGKREKCRELLKFLALERNGVISTQVMQEFYVASTGKLGADPLVIKDILRTFERFETVVITPVLIREAVDCAVINRLSFWDALIIVAAESAHCEILWTEDLNHGQIIRGVRVENPFRTEGE
ncbi:MAG: PIN domain-containing protein [Deltaproteobacteria bacterium]|nr:PIN domain-containing protein [Deltaproteobacteria bacterium]